MAFGSVGSATIDLSLDAKKAIAGLDDIRKKTLSTTKEMGSSFDRVKGQFDGIASAGKKAFIAIGGAMTAASYAATQFESQMANVSTMLSDVGMNILPELSQGILDMSMEFGEGTDTLSKGLYDILSAGIEASESMDVLAVSAMAATAGITDTGTAADAITTILNSYKLEAKDAEMVSDKLFATVKKGKTTFGELAPSIGLVASAAATAGISLDELSAVLATATKNGVRTEIAVTGLNAMLMAFLKPSESAAKAAKELGFELNTETLKSIGLVGVLDKLKGKRDEQVTAVFENARAIKDLFPILGDLEGYYLNVEYAANSAGLTQEAFNKIIDTMSKNFAKLKQAGISLLVTLGDAVNSFIEATGILDYLQDAIKGLIDWFNDLSPSTRTALAAVAALGLALSALAVTVGTIAGVIAALTTGPVVALVSAIVGAGGLVGAFGLASASFQDVEGDAKHLSQQFKDLKSDIEDDITSFNTQQQSLSALSDEYKRLSTELENTAPEDRAKVEKELQETAAKLAEIVPQASVAWSEYGEVIDIDIGKVKQFSAEQKELFEKTMEYRQAELYLLIAEGEMKADLWREEKANAQERIQLISDEIEAIRNRINVASIGGIQGFEVELVKNLERQLAALDTEAKALNVTIAKSGKGLQSLEVNKALQQEIKNIIAGVNDITPAAESAEKSLKDMGGGETLSNVRSLADSYELVNEAISKLPTPLEQAEAGFQAAYETAVALAQEGKEGTDEFTKALGNMSGAVDELSSELDTYYSDLRENSDWSTNAVIADIERRMAAERSAHGEASALYISLGQKLVSEQEKSNAAYVQIWDNTVSSIKSGMSDIVADIIKGNKDIGEAFEDLGMTIVDSFVDAFAQSMVEKLGFDKLFSSNIFGLADMFESTLGGLFSGAATEATTAIASVGAGAGGSAAIGAGGISATGTAGAGGVAPGATAIGESAGMSLGEVVSSAVIVTAIVDGLIQGTEKFNSALDKGITSADGLKDAMVGVGTIINPVGARLAESLSAANLEALGLNEGLANVGSRMVEFAVAGSVIPVIGTSLGAVAGAAFGLAENLGMVSHGTSGMENYVNRLQDIVDGVDTAAGAVAELRWLMMGEEYMDAGAGGYLSDVLEKSYEEKEEWFKDYVEDLGIYTEAQMDEIRDMMGLWETEAERAAGNVRAELAAALMTQDIWGEFGSLEDSDVNWGGFSEAFEAAFNQAKETGENMRDLYRAELESQTGEWEKSAEDIAELMRLFDERSSDWAESAGLDVSNTDTTETQQIKQLVYLGGGLDETIGAINDTTESFIDALGDSTDAIEMGIAEKGEEGNAIQLTIAKILEMGQMAEASGDTFSLMNSSGQMFSDEMGNFLFSDYISEIDWYDFIRSVDLGNYVTPVEVGGSDSMDEFGDFISRPGMGAVGFSPQDTIIGMKQPGYLGDIIGERGSRGIMIGRIEVPIYGDIRTDADYDELQERLTKSVKSALKGVS